jgi:hypothetical protein
MFPMTSGARANAKAADAESMSHGVVLSRLEISILDPRIPILG